MSHIPLCQNLLAAMSHLRPRAMFSGPAQRALLCGGILLLGAAPAEAESKAILNRLVKKGLLTQQEADEIVAEEAAEAAKTAPAPAKPADDGNANAGAPGVEHNATKQLEKRLESTGTMSPPPGAPAAGIKTPADAIGQPKTQHWYDHIRIDGYMQLRFTEQLNDAAEGLDVPNDKSVKSTEGLVLRRGRIKVTGDVNSRVHIYTQLDVQGSTGGSSLSLQARDFYADLDIDDIGEHRVRAGLSKVPFGWSNMQSSQNRLAMERPDALNSAVEGERDYGVYYMWAAKERRDIYKALLKEGLKGSGDYGVFTAGVFNGQGLNKSDLNGEPHLLARLNYPWKTESGQYYEAGVGGYAGKYVIGNAAIAPAVGGPAMTPLGGTEFRDERAFATFVMYPQPFGIEAELTYGNGPQLTSNRDRIGVSDLFGGYVTASYRIRAEGYEIIPFLRWNYYEGARKFATNAPRDKVNEFDLGTEFQFGKAWELTLSYTYTKERTNTSAAPYRDVEDAHRIAAQLQVNF